jgi:hypothetical protein
VIDHTASLQCAVFAVDDAPRRDGPRGLRHLTVDRELVVGAARRQKFLGESEGPGKAGAGIEYRQA